MTNLSLGLLMVQLQHVRITCLQCQYVRITVVQPNDFFDFLPFVNARITLCVFVPSFVALAWVPLTQRSIIHWWSKSYIQDNLTQLLWCITLENLWYVAMALLFSPNFQSACLDLSTQVALSDVCDEEAFYKTRGWWSKGKTGQSWLGLKGLEERTGNQFEDVCRCF